MEYRLGRVYKITCHLTDKIYIGSTFENIKNRYNGHRYCYATHCKNSKKKGSCSVFDLFRQYGPEHCKISLIKEYQVVDKYHLRAYESLWYAKLKKICVNKRNPLCLHGRISTIASKIYYQENKELIKEKSLKYYYNNQEKFNKYAREYYQKNKERILARSKEQYECECGAVINKYSKYAHLRSKRHIEYLNGNEYVEWNLKRKEMFECECGAKIQNGSKYTHLRSRKHEKLLAVNS